jgi:hypothetical protein
MIGSCCASQQIGARDFRHRSKADIGSAPVDVRFTPESGHQRHYSITSSAVASSVCGNVTSSVFAVLRFRIRPNFVGCSTGKSDGFVPCSILCTYVALRRKRSGEYVFAS